MRNIWIVSLFLLISLSVIGQETEVEILSDSKIQLITKHDGDQILLRWAPTEAKWWFYGINQGYSIARRDMSDPNFQYEVLVDTLLPWTAERMEAYYSENPEDEAIVLPLQTIHRDWDNTMYENDDLGDIFERSTYFNQRFETTILTADVYPYVADAAGLMFVDEDIDPEKQYSYRVRINYGGYHQAYSVVRKWQIIDKPVLHEAIEKENSVTLKWNRDLHGNVYTAYYIEKSANNIDFERLNKHPFVHGVSEDIADQKYIIYTDEVDNYTQFYYRIIGIDPFGTLSTPSEPIPAQGRDRTPPIVKTPGCMRINNSDDNEILWAHEPIEEISQVIIYKKDYQETSIVYNSSEKEKFEKRVIDNTVIDGMTDYFLVLVDTAGNVAQSQRSSLYRKDEIPPAPPINLSADVDTSGRVILKWDQGPDNDIIGYYVFTADRPNDNFIKLNQKKHAFRIYQDSINMTLLTPKRYYKVAAMDQGGNIGKFSEILEVNLPDKIPPSPCLFYNYQVDSAGIFLGLLPSSSRDVVEHRLYRKLAESSKWEIIQTFSKNPPQVFLDNKIESNKKYIYKWIAVDDANLESSPDNSTLQLTSYDIRNSFRPELSLTKMDAGIQIKVVQNIPGQDYRIQLIRSYKGSKFRTIKILSNEFEYLDGLTINPNEDPDVEYKAKILYQDGKRSKFSRSFNL